MFAILQKYDFSSKSQQPRQQYGRNWGCLRYCKSTIFQANHNAISTINLQMVVVCDTAKVRFFKQITTRKRVIRATHRLFAILQKYDFSSKSQPQLDFTTQTRRLFAILQKYDFSSKSQQTQQRSSTRKRCLRYCKSTIFQANHNSNTRKG